jgi:hypothetical protein
MSKALLQNSIRILAHAVEQTPMSVEGCKNLPSMLDLNLDDNDDEVLFRRSHWDY